MSDWISVDMRLPDGGEMVFMLGEDDKISIGFRNYGLCGSDMTWHFAFGMFWSGANCWMSSSSNQMASYRPTHWMSFPEPPKKPQIPLDKPE